MSSAHGHPTGDKHKPGGALANCTMENALNIIVQIYHRYAAREGKDDFLSCKDMTQLMQDQLPNFLSVCKRGDKDYLDKLFKKYDADHNNQWKFEEFSRMSTLIADDAHRISHNEDRCAPAKN